MRNNTYKRSLRTGLRSTTMLTVTLMMGMGSLGASGLALALSAGPAAAQTADTNPCAANPCAAAKAAASGCTVPRLQEASANPCAASGDAANPCAASSDAKTPCAAACAAANPCAASGEAKNPCAASCDAANPCAASGEAKNPCAASCDAANPCAASCEAKNPCAASCDAANPCAASDEAKNPCAASCEAKNPCAASCAAAAPAPELTEAELQTVYDCLLQSLEERAALDGDATAMMASWNLSDRSEVDQFAGWTNFATAPYISSTHGERFATNHANAIAAPFYGQFEGITEMPVGGVIAKPTFSVDAAGQAQLETLFLMEKAAAGTLPDTNDWIYTAVMPDGSLMGRTKEVNDDGVYFCAACHMGTGAETQDLLFMPEPYRAAR